MALWEALLADTAVAAIAQQNILQSPSAPPAPGNFRRQRVPESPAFEKQIEFVRKDFAPS
jgi:hypothetical protein